MLCSGAYRVDEVKNRLNSLEASQTILKLVNQVYPVGGWTKIPKNAPECTEEDWDLRSTVSSWGWRLVSELRIVKNEGMLVLQGC